MFSNSIQQSTIKKESRGATGLQSCCMECLNKAPSEFRAPQTSSTFHCQLLHLRCLCHINLFVHSSNTPDKCTQSLSVPPLAKRSSSGSWDKDCTTRLDNNPVALPLQTGLLCTKELPELDYTFCRITLVYFIQHIGRHPGSFEILHHSCVKWQILA